MQPDEHFSEWMASLPAAWRDGVADEALAVARSAHDSPGRWYHEWAHAAACIDLLRTATVERPRAVFLALAFHDAVYVAGAKDNETQSAALARETLAVHATLPPGELDAIAAMIEATRDHHALGAALDEDGRTMLDLDLATLGAPWDAYARYVEGVEREYVPEVTSASRFRIGRGAFLETLLARPRLYLTEWGEARWGATARANVARELASIRSRQGVIERIVARARRG